MKLLHKFLILGAVAGFCTPIAMGQSVRDVSKALDNPAVLNPESFETDTKAMLEDWYLKNYTVLDYEADGKPLEQVSDEVLIERLSKLPSVIEMPLNAPVRNMIYFYANRKRQLVENMLGLSLYYMPIFEEALERHKMPNELRYLPVIESALVPNAVSRVGAAGLWQFMPATATGQGLEINSLVDQRRDPYLSSDAAARYLKQLYNTYDDWSLAIAAYNCGPGNVNKALRRAGGGKKDFWEIYPFLPQETRGYVPAFIAANYIMNYHKDHNISPALARKPIVVDTVHVTRRVHFEQISEVMDIPMAELRALNPQYRKDIIPGDIRPYTLVLPSLQALAYIANEDSIVNHNAAKYARRGYVEPASGATVGHDSKGEYYDEEVVKYHTVRKGENLTKIAKKYGITVAQLRKYNRIGKNGVKQGSKLKIVTVVRKYKPAPAPQPEPTNTPTVPVDSVSTDSVATSVVLEPDSVNVEPTVEMPVDSLANVDDVANAFAKVEEVKEQPKVEKNIKAETKSVGKKPDVKPAAPAKPKTIIHVVKRGDNLSKIAQKYGVTINAIKRANNMAGDKIQLGQKLKIPSK